MTHMSQKHGGQILAPQSIAQLRQLDRAACVVCATIRSLRVKPSQFLSGGQCGTSLCSGQHFSKTGDSLASRKTLQTEQQISDRQLHIAAPDRPVREISVRESDAEEAMAILRCVVSRDATAWAEGIEGALNGHGNLVPICRLLVADIPKGYDRNEETEAAFASVGGWRSARTH